MADFARNLLIALVLMTAPLVKGEQVSTPLCKNLFSSEVFYVPPGHKISDAWWRFFRRGLIQWPPERVWIEPIPHGARILNFHSEAQGTVDITVRPIMSLLPDSSRPGLLRIETRHDRVSQRIYPAPEKPTPFMVDLKVKEYMLLPLNISSFPKALEKASQSAQRAYRKAIEGFMQVVVGSYEDRRGDWSKDFFESLKKDAVNFSEQTRFTKVEASEVRFFGEKNRPIGIIGTIRSIIAHKGDGTRPDQILPMDGSLDEPMEFNGDVKIEIGSFVIKKEFNKMVFGELMATTMRDAQWLVKRPHHQPDKNVFYTYADRASFLMYTSKAIGFKEVVGRKKIQYHGTTWTLVGSTAESILGIPDRMAKSREQWSAEEIAFFKGISDDLKDSNVENWGQPLSASSNSSDLAYFRYKINKHPAGDFDAVYLSVGNQRLPENGMAYDLYFPKVAFPLQEGDMLIERELNWPFVFSNGVLSGEWKDYRNRTHQVRFKTDSRLTGLMYFKAKIIGQDGRVEREFSVDFTDLE